MVTDLSLLRLLQLVSPSLPIGMYSYSQGLESAIDDGLVSNAEQTYRWLNGMLRYSLMPTDLAILSRLYTAWKQHDLDSVKYWSQMLNAFRETSELRAEDRQTGQALAKLLGKLDLADAEAWQRLPEATLATLFSLAAVRWQIDLRASLIGYGWGWLENQVLCAIKLVPLGQVAGQQLLQTLAVEIPELADTALALDDARVGGSTFGLALASSRHEVQYSRLFRS